MLSMLVIPRDTPTRMSTTIPLSMALVITGRVGMGGTIIRDPVPGVGMPIGTRGMVGDMD